MRDNEYSMNLLEAEMLDANDEIRLATRAQEPDHELCRDNCLVKPDGNVNTPDGRPERDPDLSRRGNKIYGTESDGLQDGLFSIGNRHERFIDDITKQPPGPELYG